MNFAFASGHFLWLLALLPVFYWYLRRFRRLPALCIPAEGVFADPRRRRRRNMVIADWFSLASAALLIIALARPRSSDEELMIRTPGIDIMLALDISGSMAAVDVDRGASRADLEKALSSGTFRSRLEVAKTALDDFVRRRPNDRIGLIVFGERPYLVVPPTLDHGLLTSQLEMLDTDNVIGRATGLAAPLALGVNRLKESPSERRVLVLFTDGANNIQDRITPVQAAELAGKFNVIVYTVGIGGGRSLMKDSWGNYREYRSDFDEPALRRLAEAGSGGYFGAADQKALEKALEEINQLERTTVEAPRYVEYEEYAPLLALAAALMLLCGLAAEYVFCLRIP